MRLEDMGSEWSGTVYVLYNTVYGFSTVTTEADYGATPSEYVRLGSAEITIPIDTSRELITRQQITNLQTEKQSVLVESQRRIDAIDQRIQSLLAIEHKGASDEHI